MRYSRHKNNKEGAQIQVQAAVLTPLFENHRRIQKKKLSEAREYDTTACHTGATLPQRRITEQKNERKKRVTFIGLRRRRAAVEFAGRGSPGTRHHGSFLEDRL
ncbi:hypothetical protein CHARACLAT_007911 [Characodon lateralis]|uniref:Uncharacterized protein n=1 Tax=Characodon lateralis TaxID=208331 RepID=A0ABU7E997_9TELE|nr:hypothetical protein [Characodon lateralis]